MRLIALDLDDTLLGPDKRISATNREAIGRAQAAGFEVTLVTARSWPATAPFVVELGLTLPVICLGGALVHRADGEIIRALPIREAVANRIAALADAGAWAARLYFANGRIFGTESTPPEQRGNAWRLLDGVVGAVEPLLQREGALVQVVTAGPRSVAESLKYLGGSAELTAIGYGLESPSPDCHFTHADVSKAEALRWLCAQYGVQQGDVTAMGDSEADLPMIAWAGVGVAMGWAPDHVRAAADVVLSRDEAHPVAAAIELLLRARRTERS